MASSLLQRKTRVLTGLSPERVPFDELFAAGQPAILRGLARHWPIAVQGHPSPHAAVGYLKRFCNSKGATIYQGDPSIRGRFFYNEQFTGLNFSSRRMPMGEYLDHLLATIGQPDAPYLYAGSVDVDTFLPGLRAENDLHLDHQIIGANPVVVSLWIGNRTIASAHFDQSHNLACCLVGGRRFSLFPPEQIANLYPGPLEPTPGGQVVSLVDFAAPDFERFPRFRDALAAGEVAELEPGDVLFYPALWWHHVEALDDFNVMMNYWWNPAPAYLDSPQITLLHALLSIRDRSPAEKRAWREFFDYYVFGDGATAAQHIPDAARGNLAPMNDTRARRLRAHLLTRLNR